MLARCPTAARHSARCRQLATCGPGVLRRLGPLPRLIRGSQGRSGCAGERVYLAASPAGLVRIGDRWLFLLAERSKRVGTFLPVLLAIGLFGLMLLATSIG